MTKSVLRSFYRPHARFQCDGRLVNPATGEITYPPSRTKQEFAAECDINNILKQFSTTGMLRHVSAKASMGAYQDLPDDVDFQESLNTVQRAQEAFMTLPSKLRARFENEPLQFLQFCADPQNSDELRKLGLANPLKEVVPVPVVVQAQEPAASEPHPKGSSADSKPAAGSGGRQGGS